MSLLCITGVLSVDHYALQGVDCAVELRISLLVRQFLFVPGQRTITTPQNQRFLLIRCERSLDIWSDTVLMDYLSTRRVIFSSSQAQTGTVRQLDHRLNRAFAERSVSHDDSSVEILQRPGNDFRTARAAQNLRPA